ncbi:MAG: hypothetical protein SFW36_09225 [Leptolyngbyaceae cyanobacterium bins.59]|nr:hypothetical protein [Leptolyngbyaceae cyanobacterium bins.59]
MAPTAKKTSSKTVTFTQDEADQALLAAIEEELAEEQYASFGELCKEALHAFFAGEDEEKGNLEGGSYPDLETLKDQLTRLEQQIGQISERSDQGLSDLQQQMTGLERTFSKQEPDDLEGQLTRVTQRITQQITQLQRRFDDFEPGGDGDSTQLHHLTQQLAYLTQQIEQVDASTSQVLTQLQEQMAGGSTCKGRQDQVDEEFSHWESQIFSLTQQLEQLEDRSQEILNQLQQPSGEMSASVQQTSPFLAQLETLFAQLTEQVTEIGSRGEERFTQLQQQFAELERSVVNTRNAVSVGEGQRRGVESFAQGIASLPLMSLGIEAEELSPLPPETDPLLRRLGPLLDGF